MKYSIVFSSVTGNTRQLADAILSVLPQENLRYFGPPAEIALEADRLYVGFWTDKGHCNKEISTFLKGVKGKEIFLFGTVKKHIDRSNTVIGTFMCQGKMPASVRERYVKMKNSPLPIPNIDKMIENFDKAILHPDYEDIDRLKGSITQV